MTNDIHALIRAFLQQQTIRSLIDRPSLPPESYTKAGVVPFICENGDFRFYVMKPSGKIPELGEPLFQIGKGTRQQYIKSSWRDIKEFSLATGEKETLAEAAIRESVEELGLVFSNIIALFDMGGFEFSSATTGRAKHMWLFAAEIKNAENFLSDAETAATTGARKWLLASEFAVAGRKDHRYIIEDIERRLRQHFQK